METTGRKWARYGLAVLAGALIALLVALRQGLDLAELAYQNARHLSDGCFVAGLLLAGVGGLAAIAATGFFDMFAYAFHSLAVLFSLLKNPREHADFYEYKAQKQARRRKPRLFLLPVGLAFLLASSLLLALHYRLPR